MSVVNEIIYPFFLQCTQYTEDKFWCNIFENLSYGICPYGVYIYNDYLSCNHKVYRFKYHLLNKEPKNLYDDIFKLLFLIKN